MPCDVLCVMLSFLQTQHAAAKATELIVLVVWRTLLPQGTTASRACLAGGYITV